MSPASLIRTTLFGICRREQSVFHRGLSASGPQQTFSARARMPTIAGSDTRSLGHLQRGGSRSKRSLPFLSWRLGRRSTQLAILLPLSGSELGYRYVLDMVLPKKGPDSLRDWAYRSAYCTVRREGIRRIWMTSSARRGALPMMSTSPMALYMQAFIIF